MLNPELKEGDRILLIHMDGESSVTIGEKGTVLRASRDPFEEDDTIYTVKWDNGSTLNLLSVTDSWVLDKESLNEQDENDEEYAKSIARTSPFNATANATSAAMKQALSVYKESGLIEMWPVPVGYDGTYKLPGVEESGKLKRTRPETQQRFIQWYDDVIVNYDSVGTRGKTFEGLIAGIFGGNVLGNENISGDDRSNKTDVVIEYGPSKGNNISVKFNKSFDETQNIGGITRAVKKVIDSEKYKFVNQLIENLPSIKRTRNGLSFTSNAVFQILKKLYENFSINGVKDLVSEILMSDDSFKPIDWFMFATEGNLNEIIIHQYKKDDIINHMLSDINNLTVSSNGMLKVKNLKSVPENILLVQFPQFTKTVRRTEPTKRGGFIYKFEDGTIALSIKKNENIIARVKRKINGDDINYVIDTLEKGISLNQENKLDYINRAIIRDIRAIESEKIDLGKDKDRILDYLKKLSNEKQKSLYSQKAKLSKKGLKGDVSRDQEIMDLFGGRGQNLNPFLIQYIRKNPDTFVKKVLDLYGDREGIKDYIQQINLGESTTEEILTLLENSVKKVDELMGLQRIFQSGKGPKIFDFFESIRKSGIVNMLESSKFAYSGGQFLKDFANMQKYSGYNIDEDVIDELAEKAEDAKYEMIRITMDSLEKQEKEPSLQNMNREIQNVAREALRYFIMVKTL